MSGRGLKGLLGLVWAALLGMRGVCGAEVDAVIVKGRGIEVKRSELEAGIARLKNQALQRGQILPEAQLDGLRQSLLDQLILVRLCAGRAEEADRAVARVEAKKFIAGLKQGRGAEGFARLLKQAGYTEAEFEAEKLAEALATAVIDREVKAAIRIPTRDVKDYYDSNGDRWIEPAAVRLLYVSLAVEPAGAPPSGGKTSNRTRMEEWKAQLEGGGKDFAAFVRTLGTGPGVGAQGGERKVIRGEIGGDLEEAMFRQEPGHFGPVVEQDGVLWFFRVQERIPARKMPIERVEEDIRALLLQRESKIRIPEYLARIRREAEVEILWKPAGRP